MRPVHDLDLATHARTHPAHLPQGHGIFAKVIAFVDATMHTAVGDVATGQILSCQLRRHTAPGQPGAE